MAYFLEFPNATVFWTAAPALSQEAKLVFGWRDGRRCGHPWGSPNQNTP